MMQRRSVVLGLGSVGLALLAPGAWAGEGRGLGARLRRLERRSGGRLGVYVLDTGTGRGAGWRSEERFGMCSTFKLSLAALTLREIDAGRLSGEEVLPYTALDLISHSPVTAAHAADGGMTVLALAECTQKTSDNLAANLLLQRLGGPGAVTAFWRSLGDPVSRLDRLEPEMNFVPVGEVRDTTSPQAIAHSVARFLTGDALTPSSRARLLSWMADTSTGLRRLRAGLPAGWSSGDKTGTAFAEDMPPKVNDIAFLRPPGGDGALWLVAAFYEPADGAPDRLSAQEAVLAEVGALAAAVAHPQG